MTKHRRYLSLCALLGLAAGCTAETNDPEMVSIEVRGQVGDRPFQCGADYTNIGTTGSTLTAQDFRLYVHDVRIVIGGVETPVTLTDSDYQRRGVALLDFETGGACDFGNAGTNTRISGTVPGGTLARGAITGVRFRIGVPEEHNHLDQGSAPAPLNVNSMYWGWEAGFKYVRIDARTTGLPGGYLLHLGATNCSGDARMGTRTCANRNVGTVAIDGFDPVSQVLIADLATLYATSDVDHNEDGSAPGCMSDPDDSDCVALFEALGVTGAQTLFRVGPAR